MFSAPGSSRWTTEAFPTVPATTGRVAPSIFPPRIDGLVKVVGKGKASLVGHFPGHTVVVEDIYFFLWQCGQVFFT
jgi:hypothetical protein